MIVFGENLWLNKKCGDEYKIPEVKHFFWIVVLSSDVIRRSMW
jgi:hypothetical protein